MHGLRTKKPKLFFFRNAVEKKSNLHRSRYAIDACFKFLFEQSKKSEMYTDRVKTNHIREACAARLKSSIGLSYFLFYARTSKRAAQALRACVRKRHTPRIKKARFTTVLGGIILNSGGKGEALFASSKR